MPTESSESLSVIQFILNFASVISSFLLEKTSVFNFVLYEIGCLYDILLHTVRSTGNYRNEQRRVSERTFACASLKEDTVVGS
jgi:hypothetical protein